MEPEPKPRSRKNTRNHDEPEFIDYHPPSSEKQKGNIFNQTGVVMNQTGKTLTTFAMKSTKQGITVLGEFKSFISRGNVIDLAVGIVMGTAFTAIVNSLVKDIITPPISLASGGLNFEQLFKVLKAGKTGRTDYKTIEEAQLDGAVTENYGNFILQIINFFIVSVCMFFLVRLVEAIKREKPSEPTEMDCLYCCKKIDKKCTRCPFCTSSVVPEITPEA